MSLTFYPHGDDAQKGTLEDRLEVLSEAADRYKAVVLDAASKSLGAVVVSESEDSKKRLSPRDQTIAYNWEEIAKVMREIRELPEGAKADRLRKADFLSKLSEVYEVLRAAKMSKLEAVRLALISEANQLRGGASQVA